MAACAWQRSPLAGLFGRGSLPDVDIDTPSSQASEQGSNAGSVQDATQDSRYDELDDVD